MFISWTGQLNHCPVLHAVCTADSSFLGHSMHVSCHGAQTGLPEISQWLRQAWDASRLATNNVLQAAASNAGRPRHRHKGLDSSLWWTTQRCLCHGHSAHLRIILATALVFQFCQCCGDVVCVAYGHPITLVYDATYVAGTAFGTQACLYQQCRRQVQAAENLRSAELEMTLYRSNRNLCRASAQTVSTAGWTQLAEGTPGEASSTA